MLKDKVAVLKSEYYKVESMGNQETHTLRAENAVLREQLRNYEAIEKEIDEAIMGLAGSEDSADPNNPYLQTINNAPTTTKRRVK